MYTPSIVLIVLCASASVLAAPFKFPKIFGSKMTPELADAETTVANWMRESTSGRLQQPGPSEYAILHKVANARVAKDAGRALKTAQTDAEGLIKQLRDNAKAAIENENRDPIAAAVARQNLKGWDKAVGNGQWKKVAAVGGGAAVVGGVGGWIGAHRVHHDEPAETNTTVETVSTTTETGQQQSVEPEELD
ncbi:hypothetical protein FRB96_005579 [Tulasnella sp. 330]|nr:hypothetical protein FRB96_005579 [Tulasnella sp. 330]